MEFVAKNHAPVIYKRFVGREVAREIFEIVGEWICNAE
jgi:hypothetical protein